MWRGLIEAYRDRLPVTDATPVVTLHEGNTPLRAGAGAVRPDRLRRLPQGRGGQPDRLLQGPRHDGGRLQGGRGGRQGDHLRLDRQHLGLGRRLRRPGRDHLRGARAGRARSRWASWPRRWCTAPRLLQVAGNFDDCLALARKLALDYPVALVNSVNPDRLHGQKTAAFEIVEALGDAPGHPLPAGRQRRQHHRVLDGLQRGRSRPATRPAAPKMYGFQAAGAAPIVTGAVVPSRRPSPPRSASATRPRGPRRSTPATSPAASSTR